MFTCTCTCCTVLMRPNKAETVLSVVTYSLVPHDDYSVMYVYMLMRDEKEGEMRRKER